MTNEEAIKELLKLKEKVIAESSHYNETYYGQAIDLACRALCIHQPENTSVCPKCGGSGVYQEYDDEFDRYHVHVCGKCEGTGDIDLQAYQPWIPCSERMPTEREWVICHSKKYGVIEASYQFGEWYLDNDSWTTDDVTHWCPLPAPPKGE